MKEMPMMFLPGSRDSVIILFLMITIVSTFLYSNLQIKKSEIRRYEKKYELELKLMEQKNLEEIGRAK